MLRINPQLSSYHQCINKCSLWFKTIYDQSFTICNLALYSLHEILLVRCIFNPREKIMSHLYVKKVKQVDNK